jgi:hypothetical protein
MATAIFGTDGITCADAQAPTTGLVGTYNVGVVYLGAPKLQARRVFQRFDVFGPAMSGRPLTPADTITDAQLLRRIFGVVGVDAFPCTLERISRANWDYLTASWNNYQTGNAWTAGGGDVATPPAALAYTAPAAADVGSDHAITGLADWVTDAIANRGGILHLRHKRGNEVPGFTSIYTAAASGASFDVRPRLVVTYSSSDASPIDHPRGGSDMLAGSGRAAPPSRATTNEQAARPAQPGRPHGR